MKEIGIELRAKREALKLSIDFVSQATRYSVAQIEALENGDVHFFKDDYAYFRLYLRGYCNYLGIDYCDIKSDVDQTMLDVNNLNVFSKNEEIHNTTRSVAEKNLTPKKAGRNAEYTKVKVKRQSQPIYSTIITVVLIVALLSFAFIIINRLFMENPNGLIDIPSITSPKVTTTTEKIPEIDNPVKIELVNTVNNNIEYVVSNSEEYKIKVEFITKSWFDVKKNNVLLESVDAKIYDKGSIVEFVVETGSSVLLNVGYMKDNNIYVNDVLVDIDETINSLPSSVKIKFDIK